MSRRRGFTLLELLIAMTIFAILGTSAVVMMRQGATLFTAGTRENELSDRQDTLLPELARDLARLAIPDSFDPPPPVPTAEQLGGARPPPPPPPVEERLRSGTVRLTEAADATLRSHPCPYLAFVVSTGEEAHDPRLVRAGDPVAPGQAPKPYVKGEVDKADRDTVFHATGGRMEVLWIAVPLDPAHPAVLSLFRGYRSPVGGAESLLDPANFNTLTKIRARCDLRHEGVLHLGITWRRVTARDWQEVAGRGAGGDVAYVGPAWDSTRALDKDWPLFVGLPSLSDPSDDLFPQYVRLEGTLAAPGPGGYGKGETRLSAPAAADEARLAVENVDALLGPGPQVRHLKVDAEWMLYDVRRVDPTRREVTVERGARGTPKAAHDAMADVHVGQASSAEIQLPVFRDFTLRRGDR